jgi:hypothetical protein
VVSEEVARLGTDERRRSDAREAARRAVVDPGRAVSLVTSDDHISIAVVVHVAGRRHRAPKVELSLVALDHRGERRDQRIDRDGEGRAFVVDVDFESERRRLDPSVQLDFVCVPSDQIGITQAAAR